MKKKKKKSPPQKTRSKDKEKIDLERRNAKYVVIEQLGYGSTARYLAPISRLEGDIFYRGYLI